MKILIIGADGQLGSDLCLQLKDNFELIPSIIDDMDITDLDAVERKFRKYKPVVIINTAAIVNADECEMDQDLAYSVNSLGARNVAVMANEINAKLIHISTDYVFGGENRQKSIPFTEFDTPVPISIYGKSKLAGENFVKHLCSKHFIIRSSGLFGKAGSKTKGGTNFVEAIIKQTKTGKEIRVVDDQFISPTYTVDLSKIIIKLMGTKYYGLLHATNQGSCSWFQFAEEIIRQIGSSNSVVPVKSDAYKVTAKRPFYSVLDNFQLRIIKQSEMRMWHEALHAYLKEKGYII